MLTGIMDLHSDNIRVVSILGRFLEHHRVFRFENGKVMLTFVKSLVYLPLEVDSCKRVDVVATSWKSFESHCKSSIFPTILKSA